MKKSFQNRTTYDIIATWAVYRQPETEKRRLMSWNILKHWTPSLYRTLWKKADAASARHPVSLHVRPAAQLEIRPAKIINKECPEGLSHRKDGVSRRTGWDSPFLKAIAGKFVYNALDRDIGCFVVVEESTYLQLPGAVVKMKRNGKGLHSDPSVQE